MSDRSPILIALAIVVGGLVAGAVLVGIGFVFIGIIVACAAIPAALGAWLVAD